MKKITTQVLSVMLVAVLLGSYLSACVLPFFLKDPSLSAPEVIQPEQPESSPEELPQDPEPEPEPEPEPAPMLAQYVRAKVNGLLVRSGPGTNYSSLGSLGKGDMVTLVIKEGDWYKTRYRNKTAYVSAGASYTETVSMLMHPLDEVEQVIEHGLSLLGHPYVYGATRLHDGKGNFLKNFDSSKYDCSSLTQYIYYKGAGILLDVTTRTQVKQGKYVARADIQRGDLMFFTNSQRYNNTGTERIGHVAMYLGDNYILHTASDHAVIEQISATRWSYYIETRRFL